MLDYRTIEGLLPDWIDWGFINDDEGSSNGKSYPLKIVGLCGAYFWTTQWILGEDEVDGVIVQKVCFDSDIKACAKKLRQNHKLFTENDFGRSENA
jgi:hypothetical protein